MESAVLTEALLRRIWGGSKEDRGFRVKGSGHGFQKRPLVCGNPRVTSEFLGG